MNHGVPSSHTVFSTVFLTAEDGFIYFYQASHQHLIRCCVITVVLFVVLTTRRRYTVHTYTTIDTTLLSKDIWSVLDYN